MKNHKIFAFTLLTAIGIVFVPIQVLAQQVITIQKGSSSATASGENNTAISNIEQSSQQSSQGQNSGTQISIQEAEANVTASGENNTVITNIEQNNHQYDDNTSSTQTSTQKARSNLTAIGKNNWAIGHIYQQNMQKRLGF